MVVSYVTGNAQSMQPDSYFRLGLPHSDRVLLREIAGAEN